MNFYAIRYFILIIGLVIIFITKKKGILTLGKAKIILLILIFYILCYIPYEKFFLDFKYLKAAFNYSFPHYEIWGTLESYNDTFVLYKKGNNYLITYFHQNNDKRWDFNNPLYQNNTSSINYDKYSILKFRTKSNQILIVVVPYDNTEDYNILDLDKKSFKRYDDGLASYYLKVANNYNDNYYIYINGEKIEIK